MNIESYIASGILEAYLLGSLSASEEAEVEFNARQYPEIKRELDRIQSDLEAIARSTAVQPAPELRNRILSQVAIASKVQDQDIDHSGSNRSSLIAAGLGLLLLGSALVYCMKSKNELGHTIEASERVLRDRTVERDQLQSRIDVLESELSILKDPQTTKIRMSGQAFAPNAFADAYWNAQTQSLYLDPTGLETPDADHQFQLWFIDADGPKNAGLIDIDPSIHRLLKMENVAAADAFAITLEKIGGSISPTLDQLVVLGEVRSS